jgi:hypothetical protein
MLNTVLIKYVNEEGMALSSLFIYSGIHRLHFKKKLCPDSTYSTYDQNKKKIYLPVTVATNKQRFFFSSKAAAQMRSFYFTQVKKTVRTRTQFISSGRMHVSHVVYTFADGIIPFHRQFSYD